MILSSGDCHLFLLPSTVTSVKCGLHSHHLSTLQPTVLWCCPQKATEIVLIEVTYNFGLVKNQWSCLFLCLPHCLLYRKTSLLVLLRCIFLLFAFSYTSAHSSDFAGFSFCPLKHHFFLGTRICIQPFSLSMPWGCQFNNFLYKATLSSLSPAQIPLPRFKLHIHLSLSDMKSRSV